MAGRGRQPNPAVREKILTTAIEVFVEKGYNANITTMIAERAAISISHMYIYFKNKEHLLVEAVRRMESEHLALSSELAEKSTGLDDESFINLFYEAQATIRHRVRFIALCMLTPGTAALFNGIDFDFSRVFTPFFED